MSTERPDIKGIKVTTGSWTQFNQGLMEVAGNFSPAGECIFDMRDAVFQVPDRPEQEAGEHRDIYALCYKEWLDEKSHVRQQETLYKASASRLTAFIAASIDPMLKAQMRIQEERYNRALRENNFIDLLNLIKYCSYPTSDGATQIQAIQALTKPMSHPDYRN